MSSYHKIRFNKISKYFIRKILIKSMSQAAIPYIAWKYTYITSSKHFYSNCPVHSNDTQQLPGCYYTENKYHQIWESITVRMVIKCDWINRFFIHWVFQVSAIIGTKKNQHKKRLNQSKGKTRRKKTNRKLLLHDNVFSFIYTSDETPQPPRNHQSIMFS